MIEEYKEKIKIILENRLEFNIDNKKEIEIVHNWLACEWQLENINKEEFKLLDKIIDKIANEMISALWYNLIRKNKSGIV